MKSKGKSPKRKKIIRIIELTILVLFFVYVIPTTIIDKLEYYRLSFEEKIIYAVNELDFEDEIVIDDILLIEEVEGGYLCVVSESEYDYIHFCYIENDNYKFIMVGETTSNKGFYLENNMYDLYNRLHISNFGKEHYYFNCYVHNEDIARVSANGNELKVYNFQMENEAEVYDMDFWFVRSEGEPEISVEYKLADEN